MLLANDDIKQLSFADKHSLMEQLWESMSPDEVPIPKWHQDLLTEREMLVEQGKASFIDWNFAKQQIQKIVG